MTNFEEVGQVIDSEVECLRRYVEEEVRPSTRRKLVEALRAASKRLEKLAEQLDTPEAPPSTGGGAS